MEIKIGYMPINRGRNLDQAVEACLEFLYDNHKFILVLDESDATDRELGLDGRQIFKLISEKSHRKDIQYYLANDIHVGTNFIASDDFFIKDTRHEQINKLNLLFPQGKSEKYMHHRLTSKFEFSDSLKSYYNFDGIYLVSQHNSAFVRPLTRLVQSFQGMQKLIKSQYKHPNYFGILIRDQNTMFPGEGLMEKLLRRLFNLNCVTDTINWRYKIENLEGDSGGANLFATWFRDIGGFRALRKVITIADKIESMCIQKDKEKKLNLKITPKHRMIEKSDHGLLSITIKRIDNS